jgi:inorganic pyrophosphatase
MGMIFHIPDIMSSVTVIIETPRHTGGKYVFDPDNHCYRLKKILPLGMYFPYDFGFIESTHAGDGDPADAMVITECITYPGIRLICRIIGALEVKQIKKGVSVRNDRYFAVPEASVMFEHIKEIKDFSREHNQQLRDFFINYTKAENKKLTGLTFINAGSAKKSLQKLVQ